MILKMEETIVVVSMTSSLKKEYLNVMENEMVLSNTYCDIFQSRYCDITKSLSFFYLARKKIYKQCSILTKSIDATT